MLILSQTNRVSNFQGFENQRNKSTYNWRKIFFHPSQFVLQNYLTNRPRCSRSILLCAKCRHWCSKFLRKRSSYPYIVKRIIQMSSHKTDLKIQRNNTTWNKNSCWTCNKFELCGYRIYSFSNDPPRHSGKV